MIDFVHPFVGDLVKRGNWLQLLLKTCTLCGQHRWYRLHNHTAKPMSKSEYERCL